jgi:hypothetical protein
MLWRHVLQKRSAAVWRLIPINIKHSRTITPVVNGPVYPWRSETNLNGKTKQFNAVNDYKPDDMMPASSYSSINASVDSCDLEERPCQQFKGQLHVQNAPVAAIPERYVTVNSVQKYVRSVNCNLYIVDYWQLRFHLTWIALQQIDLRSCDAIW